MRTCWALASGVLLLFSAPLASQELEPGAYSISPVGVNFFQAGYVRAVGDVSFTPALPVEDVEATINTVTAMYGRSFSLFGRSANLGIVAPYTDVHLEGLYLGEFTEVDRTGFRDPMFRLGVNLYGAPAMQLQEFAKYKQKTNIGASLRILGPLGQYDSTKLINLGSNRWSFKPEVGVSRALGKWTLELYAGVWWFTDNTNFYGGKTRKQDPIGSFQVHVLHTFKPRMWLSFDVNYYTGGTTRVDGVENLDLQQNSRAGLTFVMPLDRRSSLRFAYSRGARTTVGGDFDAFALGYAYFWGGGL